MILSKFISFSDFNRDLLKIHIPTKEFILKVNPWTRICASYLNYKIKISTENILNLRPNEMQSRTTYGTTKPKMNEPRSH